ncbi:Uma2 family endonuclease [soil metagenome]
MRGYPMDASEAALTLEEFQRLPEEDLHRVELVRGRLVREPRPGAEHGFLTTRLIVALDAFVRERELGLVVAETGFLLSDDPPTVRGPDVAFIAAEDLPPEGIPEGFWKIAPRLAVEVVSPSNTASGIRAKVLEYLAAGTLSVWVVDPATRSVTTYRSRTEIRLLASEDELDGGEVLPGFRLRLPELFSRP